MKIKIIYSDISMRKELEKFGRISRFTKTFEYSWAMWGRWKSGNFPIIAIDTSKAVGYGKLVGFNAPGYGVGVSYLDCYFQAVLPLYRGHGIAGRMLKLMFGKAHKLKIKRFRLRIMKDNADAIKFWKGFGMRPFAERGDYLLWDVDIRGVKDGKSLIAWMAQRKSHEPIPERSMKRYIRTEAKFLRKRS